MTLHPINSISMNVGRTSPQTDNNTNPQPKITMRNFTAVSYTTVDGGLFVGYYLNLRG